MIRALVTGGSGSIGEAISQELAKNGMHVLVHGFQNRKKANAVTEEIIKSGGSAFLM